MRTRLGVLLSLLLVGLIPLVSDAGAGQARCCNLAASFTQNLFPGGQGDEDFFTVPGGPPNVMVLLDNSGSMLNFPRPLPFPSSLTASHGTCAVAEFEDVAAARLVGGQTTYESAFNYATTNNPLNGNSNSPGWVTGRCGGTGTNSGECLFHPSKYYHYGNPPTDVGGGAGDPPWTETAGQPSTSDTAACSGLSESALSNCTSCLASKGYYLYLDSSGNRQAAFVGSFLNVYPPKFMIARKVLKDILAINPAAPAATDAVRFGLTTLGSSTPLKPLLPGCDAAISTTAAFNFVAARQDLLTAIDGIRFSSFTPLAETLFKVAQYYSDGADAQGTGSQWASWFPSGTWQSGFWNGLGSTTSVKNSSICWACQQSSVVIISDGAPYNDNDLPSTSCSSDHASLLGCPSSGKIDFLRWKGGTVDPSRKLPIDCPLCGTDLSSSSKPNLLHLVAAFLHYTDMRKDPAAGNTDTTRMAGMQTAATYTIGVNLEENSTATYLLRKTAELGGGTYVNSSNPSELESAFYNAVTDIINKATSFSVSNTNTLQASTAAQLFTARFRPLDRLSWEGHLFRFTLFNELALGCDPTKTHSQQTPVPSTARTCAGVNPNIDGKTTSAGLADCSDFYIVDADCTPVLEDSATGAFMKATFVNGVATATTQAARPYWDAGSVLSTPESPAYRSADEGATNRRRIYTVLDNDSTAGDGRFDANDSMVEFSVANVAAITPYLSLDATWCASLYSRLGFTLPTSWGTTQLQDCARQVIWFIRGFDVLDEDDDGCAGPGGLGPSRAQGTKACTVDSDCSPSTANACTAGRCVCSSGTLGEERDIASGHWKLGDIFHSSPQAVEPPFDEVVCDIGRAQTQCVATIHSAAALTRETQTAIEVDADNRDAYEQWRLATTDGVVNRRRQRIVLAGSNDGMLHAFDGGSPYATVPDAFGSFPYDEGTGAELWAFIPPDLLPKLKYALDGHQYFVDGNIMVRDVWYDQNSDRTKQASEFHTLAILSERAGGSQFVALDVTNPLVPRFRWTFPQLCSLEQNLVGQSWTDFTPRPPPIGPVKIALPGTERDAKGRRFEERWIAMLNGGYDPSGSRGRGVWMVDAWTGTVLWQFTDLEFQAVYSATPPAGTSTGGSATGTRPGMFPVAASPGLVDIGNANQATLDSDGYFDTATWGDTGGQLWVARFQDPGVLGANGRVTNWYGARSFEELRQVTDDQLFWQLQADGVTRQFRNEFYRMTSNIWEPNTATLRSFLGSGNRDRLLTVGPICGPSSFLGCAQSDCNVVNMTTTTKVGACTITTKFVDNNNRFQHNAASYQNCGTAPLDCSGGVSVSVNMHLNQCPSSATSKTTNPADVNASLNCDSSGTCSSRVKIGKTKELSTKNWPALTNHNRFYGLWTYSADRSFNSLSTAKAFDMNRFTDVPYAGTCAGTVGNTCTVVNTTQATVATSGAVTCRAGTSCSATAADPGWFYEYGRVCPLASGCTDAPPPWTDEKTGSGATVLGSCVVWNTIRPRGAAVGGTPCAGGGGLPENYTYLADTITGVPDNRQCGYTPLNAAIVYRASSRRSIAPPLDPTPVVTVSSTGQVRQSALQIEPGSLQKKDLATSSDVLRPIYWLEVPRDLHACRHGDASLCK